MKLLLAVLTVLVVAPVANAQQPASPPATNIGEFVYNIQYTTSRNGVELSLTDEIGIIGRTVTCSELHVTPPIPIWPIWPQTEGVSLTGGWLYHLCRMAGVEQVALERYKVTVHVLPLFESFKVVDEINKLVKTAYEKSIRPAANSIAK